MREEIHARVTGAPQPARRRIRGEQLTAGTPPAAQTHDARPARLVDQINGVEWRDDPALDARVRAAGAAECHELTPVVWPHVGDAPAGAADANEIARVQFLHRASAARVQENAARQARPAKNQAISRMERLTGMESASEMPCRCGLTQSINTTHFCNSHGRNSPDIPRTELRGASLFD
jgi:hypothetical protein